LFRHSLSSIDKEQQLSISSVLLNFIIYYTTPFRRAREQIVPSFFVKNCQCTGVRADLPTGIIQRVIPVEVNKSGNGTSPWLRRIILRILLAALALLGIAYGADFCVFRYRLAAKRQPFGTVTVEHYYEVAHKDGKAELIFDPPVQKTCVHSLFPHSGDPPCWFLTRHAEPKTDI